MFVFLRCAFVQMVSIIRVRRSVAWFLEIVKKIQLSGCGNAPLIHCIFGRCVGKILNDALNARFGHIARYVCVEIKMKVVVCVNLLNIFAVLPR